MKIVSSKQIDFLVSNIFEKYYEPVHTELTRSGLNEEIAYKTKQEILTKIYRSAMDKGIENEDEFDRMAVTIINEQLEKILVPYYARKYIEKYSLEHIARDNGMLLGIQEEEETIAVKEEPETEETVAAEEIKAAETATVTAAVTEEEELPVIEDIPELFQEQSATPIVRRMEEPRIRRFRINWFLTISVSLLASVVIWFVVGILMKNGYLPILDIGYSWFNSHIWNIF